MGICEMKNLKPATVKLKSYSVSLSEEAKVVPNSTVDIEKAVSDVKNDNSMAPIERLKPLEEARQCVKGDVESKTKSFCDEGNHSNQTLTQQSHSPNNSLKFSSKCPLKRSASTADSKPCKRQLTLPDLFRMKNKEITDRASLQPKIRTLKDWLVDRKSLPDEKGKHANASESRRWSVNGWKVTENDGQKIRCKRKRGEDCVKRKHKLVNSEIMRSLSQSKIPFLHSDNNKLVYGNKRTEGVSVLTPSFKNCDF
ncbi:hypothetical protein J437_LFUL016550 [Ladona fulva]|uniref:Uncharacterized protein n=1 Tax=Ladona fulva TaxID=123851 RepID=A0A8K0P8F3_LADFU|nr:hypothetical protein J437_LFUL016550 [Ladona fulva]